MTILPIDFITEVGTKYVPFVDAAHMTAVCKAWQEAIGSHPLHQCSSLLMEVRLYARQQRDDVKNTCLYIVGTLQARYNFAQTEETVDEITDQISRDIVLLQAGQTLAPTDPALARSTVDRITATYQKSLLLIAIAGNDPQHDLTEAEAMIDQISDPFLKDLAILEMIKVKAQYDLAGAKQLRARVQQQQQEADKVIAAAQQGTPAIVAKKKPIDFSAQVAQIKQQRSLVVRHNLLGELVAKVLDNLGL